MTRRRMTLKIVTAFALFLALPLLAGQHEDAERDHHPMSAHLATGDLAAWRAKRNSPYDWPVQVLSIGHTIASYQNYSRIPGGAYFHHGLDIRADAGSPVYAAAGGRVVNVENYVAGSPAYWEIAILDDDGFLWQYHHVDRDSIPQEVHQAFKTGGKIATGTKIGEVYYWMVTTFGERYHHVHLNVLGKSGEYLNPFAFLKPLGDSAGPIIKQIQLGKNGAALTGTTVSGSYTLLAELSDLILHQQFLVPPNSITVEVDGQMPFVVWQFDNLPGGSSNTDYVDKFYVAKTCGNYSCRRHVVDLGFRKQPRQVFPQSSGAHHAVVKVRDFEGNVAEKRFEWSVQ